MAKKTTTTDKKSEALDAVIKALDKSNETVYTGENYRPQTYLDTGFYQLNKMLGGGIPAGRLTQIWGNNATGKSALCRHLIAQVQKQFPDKVVIYYNTEFDYSPEQFKEAGVNLDMLVTITDNITEKAYDTVISTLKTGKVSLAIIDSLGGLQNSNAFFENKATPAEFARLTKAFASKFCKLISEFNCYGIVTNQITQDIMRYGDTTDYPGGNAWKHALQVNMKLSRVAWLPDASAETKEGLKLKVDVVKNKLVGVSKTDDTNHIDLWFTNCQAKNELTATFNEAVDKSIIQARGAWIYLYDENGEELRKWNGKKLLQQEMQSNPDTMKQIKELCGRTSTIVSPLSFEESDNSQDSTGEEDFVSDSD